MARTSRAGLAAAVMIAAGAAAAQAGGPDLARSVDPSLAASHQADFDPDAPVAGYDAPDMHWQLGVPINYGNQRAFLVADAEQFLAQLPEDVRQKATVIGRTDLGELVSLPDESTGLGVRGRCVGGRCGVGGYAGLSVGWSGAGVSFGNGAYPGEHYRRYPWWYGERRRWYRYGYEYRYPYGPIDGQLSPGYAPVPPEPEPEVVLTPEQTAAVALASRDYSYAVERYREHLTANAEDMDAMRRLGVALLGDRRMGDAAAAVLYAYAQDPSLAHQSMSLALTGGSSLEMRTLLTRAVRYAHARPSSSAWLLVTVLAQAEGRLEAARTFLDKAEAQGLDAETVRTLRVELTRL